jgi:hypothetical protein
MLRTEKLCGAAAALALPGLLTGCATSADRWSALSDGGPLASWAACMESDGYRAFYDAGDSAVAAAEDGATPISNTEIFLIGLKRCEPLAAGTRAADLAPQNRNRLYRDTERRLLRKLANGSHRN